MRGGEVCLSGVWKFLFIGQFCTIDLRLYISVLGRITADRCVAASILQKQSHKHLGIWVTVCK